MSEKIERTHQENATLSDDGQKENGLDDILDADQTITARSIIYAGIGLSLAFIGGYALSTISLTRASMGVTIHAGENAIWLLNVANVAQACLGPPLLYASDLFGRRYFLVVCSLCGVVGTVVASRSHSFGVGLFGFCLGAVGLACIPAGYAIPSEVLPRKWRGGAQAAVISSACGGGLLGSLITAVLLRSNPVEGWRNALYVYLGIWIVAFLLCTFVYFPPPRPDVDPSVSRLRRTAEMDWVGYAIFMVSLCLFLVGTTFGSTFGWTASKTLGTLVSGCVLGVIFGLWEWKGTATGLCHHALFKNRNFALSLIAITFEGVLLFGLVGFIGAAGSTLWDTTDPVRANGYLALFYGSAIPFAIISGWYSVRFKSFRMPLMIGYAFYSAGCAALSTTNRTSGSAAWGYALMTGIGFSAPIALLMAVAQLAVPGLYIGAATALSASARSVGGAVGLSIFQAILNSKMTDAVPKYVAQGAFKGGLAMSQANTVLPTLIPAVASGDAQVIAGLSSIPGITPQIIDDAIIGFQDALAHSLRYVWIACAVFAAGGMVSVAVLRPSTEAMNGHIDAPAKHSATHAHEGAEEKA